MKKGAKKEKAKRQLGRVPLPRKVEKVHSTKRGKRGYNRNRKREEIRHETD